MKRRISEFFDVSQKEINEQEQGLFIVNFPFNRNLASKTIQVFNSDQKEDNRLHFLFEYENKFVYEYDI